MSEPSAVRPPIHSLLLPLTQSVNGEDVSWNVTTLVAGWVDGSFDNHGFAIDSSIGNQLHFASREGAAASPATFEVPRLIINSVPEPSAIGWLLPGAVGLLTLTVRLGSASRGDREHCS